MSRLWLARLRSWLVFELEHVSFPKITFISAKFYFSPILKEDNFNNLQETLQKYTCVICVASWPQVVRLVGLSYCLVGTIKNINLLYNTVKHITAKVNILSISCTFIHLA